MRRWAFVVVLLLFAAGCGKPAGTDGSLVDDWPAPAEPTVFTPAAGVCLPEARFTGIATYTPLDCSSPHEVEVVHVGQFAGTDVTRSQPPARGSTGLQTAFAACDKATKEYVGGDWRGARLYVEVSVPNLQAWQGGARWYRCDVNETLSLDSYFFQKRTSSVRDLLKTDSNLLHRCFNPALIDGDLERMEKVDCDKPHRAEYAGVWTAPDTPYADFTKNSARTHQGCRGVIAAFTKVPNDNQFKYRIGTIIYNPTDWTGGDRGVRCFLWDDKDMKRSMKGAGPAALPID